MLIGFTDYSTDAATRDTLGWIFIGLASSIIAVTAAAIVYEVSTLLKGKWIIWKEKQTAAKKYDINIVNRRDGRSLEEINDANLVKIEMQMHNEMQNRDINSARMF